MGLDDDDLHTADPNDDGPITASGLRQYVLAPLSSKIDDLGDVLGSILEREDQQAQALATLAGELTSTPRAVSAAATSARLPTPTSTTESTSESRVTSAVTGASTAGNLCPGGVYGFPCTSTSYRWARSPAS